MYVAPDKMEFRVVFDGRLVDGFTHENVRNAFQERFGEASTCAVFGKSQAVIKKGLTQEQAELVKSRLAGLGMDVSIEEVMPVGYGLSLIEEEGGQAIPAGGPQARRTAANDGDETDDAADFPGVHAVNDTYAIRDIEAAFTGPVELPAVPRQEVLRSWSAAALSLAIPFAYLLVALVGLRSFLWMLFGGRQAFFSLIDPGYLSVGIYLLLLAAGGLFTLLLFKPFIARRASGPRPVTVEPVREQVLFAFVEEVAEAVGAPMPEDVLFDTGARVTTRSVNGPFAGEYTLTVGLPLIWSSDVRSLAGALAAELGKLADPRCRRARLLGRRADDWLERRLRDRDNWDVAGERWSASDLKILKLAGSMAGRGAELCRLLLERLADTARRFVPPGDRDGQAEAERYAPALVGSEQYARTKESFALIAALRQAAVGDLESALDAGRMVDNLPRMIAERAERLDASERARLLDAGDEEHADRRGSSPPRRQSVRRTAEPEAEAALHFEGPASGLVRDLDRLSKLATLEWYRAQVIDVAPDDLLPLEAFESEAESQRRATDSNHRYFGELSDLPMHLPLPGRALTEKISTGKLVAGLGNLKEKFRSVRVEAVGRRDRLYLQREYQRYYEQAAFWAEAGLPVEADTYRLKLATTDPKEMSGYLSEHRKSENALAEELRSVMDLLGKRLGVGLELARRLDPGSADDVDLLCAAYEAVSATFVDARDLENSGLRLELLIGFCDQAGNKPEQRRRLDAEVLRSLNIRERIRESCAAVRDPFRPEVTLDFALPDSPAAGSPDPREVLDDATETLRQLERLAFRLRGRMAELALAAEEHHGIL